MQPLTTRGSLWCLLSPQSIVTNWWKVLPGSLQLPLKASFALVKAFMWWPQQEHANGFISHNHTVFQDTSVCPYDISSGNALSLGWILKQVVSDWQPSSKTSCDSFKDHRNKRISLPHSKSTLQPHLENIPCLCACRTILKFNPMRCQMADTSLTSRGYPAPAWIGGFGREER